MILSLLVGIVGILFPIPLWVFFVTGAIDGVVWLPVVTMALAPYLGPLRGALGRLNYLFAAVVAGFVVLVRREDGYEFAPYEDGLVHLGDGRKLPFDPEDSTLYRLGRRPFAVCWAKAEDLLDEYAVLDPVEVDAENDEHDIGALPEERAGIKAYTPEPEVAQADQRDLASGDAVAADGGELADGWPDRLLLDWIKPAMEVKGGATCESSEAAETKVMRDEGGDTDLSMRMRVYGSIISLLAGAIVGIIVLAVV